VPTDSTACASHVQPPKLEKHGQVTFQAKYEGQYAG